MRTADAAISVPGMNYDRLYNRVNPVQERLERGTVVHDWIPRDTRTLNRLARMIYLTDPVAGPAVDFYREIPFGPTILGSVKDRKRLQFYNDALEALNLTRYLPYLAGDILVVGRLIVHLLWNQSKGLFDEIIPLDSDFVTVEPSPIAGQPPILDLLIPPQYQKWATNPDPRIVKQRREIDPKLVKLMAAGSTIPLESENTIYVPRRMSANDDTGTTIFMRIFPIVAIEWAYLTSEATALRRRAAPWTVATVGIEDKWDPTVEELVQVHDMLMAAEEDPVGAKLVFRHGVELSAPIAGATDIAKWLEQWGTLKESKLQGLGMNEAFATGEASWSYLESMLSLGMERIRNFRKFIAQEVLLEGILAPLARVHGFYRRKQSEIDHRIRTSSKTDADLDLPTIEWSRSLQPTSDKDYLDILDMMANKGIPITMRKWAQAAGYDLEEALDSMPEDLALRKRINDYNDRVKALGGKQPAEGEEGEEEGGGTDAYAAIRDLSQWRDNEFMGLTQQEAQHLADRYLPRHALSHRDWKKAESQMLESGVRRSKLRAFQYLLRRGGVLQSPLSLKTVHKVRDELLRKSTTIIDRRVLGEIHFLNDELERTGAVERAPQQTNAIPWARPVGPRYLMGDGNNLR